MNASPGAGNANDELVKAIERLAAAIEEYNKKNPYAAQPAWNTTHG